MTKRPRKRDSAVIISSTIPSAKYAWSWSPLRSSNGRTAMDGLVGNGRTFPVRDVPCTEGHSWRKREYPKRLVNVLQRLLPEVSEESGNLSENHRLADCSGNDDSAGLRNALETGGNIYGCPMQFPVLANDVPRVNTYADLKLLLALAPAGAPSRN